MNQTEKTNRLKEIALLFLKLGVIGFGGPAAHIAMMQDEVVEKRKWLTRQHFLDLVGATNLIPGPNSTEMAIHVGFVRAGWLGLIVAGACFILPAVAITGVFAWFYVAYGQTPQVEPFLYGIKPAVLAVILGAVWKLSQTAVKGWSQGAIGAAALISSLVGFSEVLTILAGGVLGMLWLRFTTKKKAANGTVVGALTGAFTLSSAKAHAAMLATATTSAVAVTWWKLGLVFLKVGAVLYGSGYVLVAFLDGELVQRLGWLTETQLLDAIAIGQFTPGPVLSTATFIGYQIQGWTGALVATLGIFLPSFLFVAILNPIVPRLRKSLWTSSFLDAVNVASVGLMAAVLIKLGISTLTHWSAWVIALIAGVVVVRYKINAAYLVLGGAVFGGLVHALGFTF